MLRHIEKQKALKKQRQIKLKKKLEKLNNLRRQKEKQAEK